MLKRLRTVLFWAHLLTGVSAAAIILIMSGTGVLLTYQRQIQAWADTRGLDGAAPMEGAESLSPEALVSRAEAGRARRPTSIRWRRDPAAPVEVAFGRDSVVFINGYTGMVLGQGSARTRAFFASVMDWHRWLAQGEDGRGRGRAVTGAANLAFLFLVLAGFVLWWPRNPTRRSFRNILVFRRGLSSKARDFNWHNVIGIWVFLPLVIVITSAVVISYAWAGGLVERLTRDNGAAGGLRVAPAPTLAATGRLASTASASTGAGPGTAAAAQTVSPTGSPDATILLERARAQVPDWSSVTMDLLPRGDRILFVLDRGSGGQPQKQARLMLSSTTGEVVSWEPFSTLSRPARVRSLMRYMHTGEVLGVAGQTIAGGASAGAILLVWTGVALALRRLNGWVRRRRPRGRSGRGRPAAVRGTQQAA